jgi:hypothetical protein
MKYSLIAFFTVIWMSVSAQCDSIPPLNKEILTYVKSQLTKKVGRGECWDLASYALNKVGAKWDGLYVYGRKLLPGECVQPGDIIQFENVKLRYSKGKKTFTEEMKQHTAIIFAVKNSDEVILAHQNTDFSGKKVGKSPLVFSTIYKGKYSVYRPEK